MLKKNIEAFLQLLGKPLLSFVLELGAFTRFVAKSVYNCFVPPFYLKLFVSQFLNMGFYSLPVVGLTTLFGCWAHWRGYGCRNWYNAGYRTN